MRETGNENLDLRDSFKAIKKRGAMVILVTLLFVAAAGVLSFKVLPPVYEAKALLMLTQVAEKQPTVNQGGDLSAIANSISRIPVLTMNSYLAQMRSEALMQRVINRLHLDERGYDINTLAGQIRTEAENESNLIEVSVSNTDPNLASEIATAMHREFELLMKEKNQELMGQSIQSMQAQALVIRRDYDNAASEAERMRLNESMTLLNEKIKRTQTARSLDLGSTSMVVVSPAQTPTSPVRPNKVLNMTVTGMLGLILSIFMALILEQTEDKKAASSKAAEPNYSSA